VATKQITATIIKVKDFQEFARLGVFSTPAIVIDGQVKCVGRVPKQEEVEKWIS
jgi:predicted thioredoxin/glutaredoxin